LLVSQSLWSNFHDNMYPGNTTHNSATCLLCNFG
jgi:hypothetical protein